MRDSAKQKLTTTGVQYIANEGNDQRKVWTKEHLLSNQCDPNFQAAMSRQPVHTTWSIGSNH